MSGPRGSKPPFDVWLTREAAEDVKALRGAQARAVKQARAELQQIGCRAAHYRLSGAGVEHLCVLRLRDNFRMVLLFPAEDEVAVLLVGPHERENPDLDVYRRLYEALGHPAGNRAGTDPLRVESSGRAREPEHATPP